MYLNIINIILVFLLTEHIYKWNKQWYVNDKSEYV